MQPLSSIRKDYTLQSLNETDVETHPIAQFTKWWQEAINSEIDEVNAMTLATVTADNKPNARIVLLKGYNENGFVFYTNYNSKKGKEIERNPFACLVFFWKELQRQIRIEGEIEKVSDEENNEYFESRPQGSKMGAWASPQSTVIQNRAIIEESFINCEKRFSDGNIPRPSHWGGYVVKPIQIEFWQGRSNRLHDRIRYSLKNDEWIIERLAP